MRVDKSYAQSYVRFLITDILIKQMVLIKTFVKFKVT